MKICLTGFGKFSGVETNPTTEIVRAIEEEHWVPTVCMDSADFKFITDVVEVSTTGSDLSLQALVGSDSAAHTVPTLLIHLGVDGRAEQFKLESTAYNNMTFRVPDELGNQFTDKVIDEECALDSPMCSKLPLQEICSLLQSQGHNVTVSSDPGRFICNFIYFQSLRRSHSLSESTASSSSASIPSHSLFIHVPPKEKIPIQEQTAFVKSAVDLIVDRILSA